MVSLNGFNVSINTLNIHHSWSEPIEPNQSRVIVDQAERILTCEIMVEAGKHFYVIWKCKPGIMKTHGELFIDGVSVGSQTISKAGQDKGRRANFSVASIRSKEGKQELLTFNDHSVEPLEFVKDPDSVDVDMDARLQNTAMVNRGTGEVRLVINQIDRVAQPDPNLINVFDNCTESSNRTKTKRMADHVATFVFKYRHPDHLENKDVYDQQASSAVYEETDIKSSTMVPEDTALHLSLLAEVDNEIEALQKRLNELHAKKAILNAVQKRRKYKRPTPASRRTRRPAFIISAEKDAKTSQRKELTESNVRLSRSEKRRLNKARKAADAMIVMEETPWQVIV